MSLYQYNIWTYCKYHKKMHLYIYIIQKCNRNSKCQYDVQVNANPVSCLYAYEYHCMRVCLWIYTRISHINTTL